MSTEALLAMLLLYVAGIATVIGVGLIVLLRRTRRLHTGVDGLALTLNEEIARRNGPEAAQDHIAILEILGHIKAFRQTVALSDQKLQDVRIQVRDLHTDLKDRVSQSSFNLRRALMDHERHIVDLLAKAMTDHRIADAAGPREAGGETDTRTAASPHLESAEWTETAPPQVSEPFRRPGPRRTDQER